MQKDKALKRKISHKIGLAIKFYRDKTNLSQEELAGLIEADRTYISAIGQGVKCPSVYCLYCIAKALKLKMKDLLDINL